MPYALRPNAGSALEQIENAKARSKTQLRSFALG